MTIDENIEINQPNNTPLVVGGNFQDFERNRWNKKYIKVGIIILSFIQIIIFLAVLYSAFISPLLETNKKNTNYTQPVVMPHNEQEQAEKRYKEIIQSNNIEACSEFKNKEYQKSPESGGGRTSYFYTCVYNISVSVKDESVCLALSDDYSKRVCLQALSAVFKNPKYCQEANQYAFEEVAKEQYSQADSDNCYFTIKACNHIINIGQKEGCLLYSARDENVLDITLCRSFSDSKRKKECIGMVSVIENNQQYCQESDNPDDCYWNAVKIAAPNLKMEKELNKSSWCGRIKDKELKADCLQ